MATAALNIGGMHCASCVSHVEKAILRVPGVRAATVNLATGQGRVDYDPPAGAESPDRTDDIVNAVTRAGYTASVAQPIGGMDEAGGHAHHAHGGAQGAADDAALWRRRALFGAMLGLPVVILGMTWMSATSAWLQLVPASIVQTVLGGVFIRSAYRGLRARRVDMDALVAMGTLAAFAWSIAALLRADHHVYFDTSVVILTLIALGKFLEARARGRAGDAMAGLLALLPRTAALVRAGAIVDTPVENLHAGDEVLVRPGERVAVDGVIIDGVSDVDESLVSGESVPVAKQAGQRVVGGSLNITGTMRVKATAVGAGSTVAQVATLVADAQSRKASVQRLADRIAGVFVPVVIAIAAVAFLVWGLAIGNWTTGTWAAVSVLIVACPCALGLAVPTAVMVGSAVGAKSGIVIKDPVVLERAGNIRTVVLDKTGTLTRGEPTVIRTAITADGLSEREALTLAAALERSSTHPIAAAIIRAAGDAGEIATAPRTVPGQGVFGDVRARTLGVVAPALAADAAAHREQVATLEHDGATVVALVDAPNGRPAATLALIALRDEPRPEARAAIARLREIGLEPVMLTGDSETAAASVANSVGIERVKARVSPGDKERAVRELAAAGPVAMVGDGLNDAPALAAADIGIAMGSGTHIAASAGHVLLVGGDLRSLPRAVLLSRAMMRRIRLGLFWAFAYNAVLIPVAALGWLHPMLAALAMSLSSVSVVVNALALRRVKLD